MKWQPWKYSALFYWGLVLFLLFEILKVYFIMPFPGSQKNNTLEIAFFLHHWRTVFRIFFGLMILFGFIATMKKRRKWVPFTVLIPIFCIIFIINAKMQAEKMFLPPATLIMANAEKNQVDLNSLVVGVEMNGEAKAYPIKFIAYHHIVYDMVGGENLMITYCSVCRTGRVFVNPGEKLRLVGMDHFNAMFEDAKTKSWWRQATGECVIGKRKGEKWTEKLSLQMSLDEWFKKYPTGKVMQPDSQFIKKYDITGKFEQGKEKGSLERTDTVPWQNKSWVVGVTLGSASKAYDWIELKNKRLINDTLANQKVIIVMHPDNKTYAAYLNLNHDVFELKGDTLISGSIKYNFNGTPCEKDVTPLQSLYSYQEFWHSWKFFHPGTLTYHH